MVSRFPEKLMGWAGHREGGVRKPFCEESGKPTGEVIQTRLTRLLGQWAQDVGSGQNAPRVVLLVGGPGNGKTEAIEYAITCLDASIGANGRLVDAISKSMLLEDGFIARKVSVKFHDVNVELPCAFRKLELVQDATSTAVVEKKGIRPEKLLIDDLARVINDESVIYFAAINRGVLAHALGLLEDDHPHRDLLKPLLEKITLVSSVTPNQPSCWPLENFPSFGVWPMDVESLLEAYSGSIEDTPAYEIFKKVLAPSEWESHGECPARDVCPFKANQETLSNLDEISNLLKVLRYFELVTEKRWSFRDFFTLVAHLVVGHENHFKKNGSILKPCAWVREQAKGLSLGGKDKVAAALSLTSRLYQHALFPSWPKEKDFLECSRAESLLKALDDSDNSPRYLMAAINSLRKTFPVNELNSLLLSNKAHKLDPGKASGSTLIHGQELTVDKLEDAFSYSVKYGWHAVRDSLTRQENILLEWMAASEELLGEGLVKKTQVHEASYLKTLLRSYSSKLVKRSLGVRAGVCDQMHVLDSYRETVQDKRLLLETRKAFSQLLNPRTLDVSLRITFGQPVPSRENDVTLEAEGVQVKIVPPVVDDVRPLSLLPFIHVLSGDNGYSIPLTYNLFEALNLISSGLRHGCLPSETIALLEGVKSRLAGIIVNRGPELESAIIRLGATGYSLDVVFGNIEVMEVGQP